MGSTAVVPAPDPNQKPGSVNNDVIVEFKSLMDEYRNALKKAIEEKLEKGEPLGETKERLVKFDAAITDLLAKFGEMQKRTTLLEERSSRPFAGGGAAHNGNVEYRSLGRQFVEAAEYKSANLSGTNRMHLSFTLKSPLETRVINPFISEELSGYPILPYRAGVVLQPTFPLVMRSLLDQIPVSSNSIEYVKESWTLNADYQVKEGDKKAQSDVVYTDASVMVRTIAHYIKISRQMLADAPYVVSTIDSRMRYGIAKKEDLEILHGDNAAGHLWGIMPQATGYVPPSGVTIEGAIDTIYGAILQVMTNGYAPSAIVLNPMGMAGMALAKNTMGGYILPGPPMTEATPRLWGLPVAVTINMAPDAFLVGAFPGNAALFDRETTTVDIAYENEDDFVRNLVTIRAEERLALAVYVPAAFVKGTLPPPVVGGGLAAPQAPSRGDRK